MDWAAKSPLLYGGFVPENIPWPEMWVFRRTPPAGKLKVTPRKGRFQVIIHRIVGLGSEEHPTIRGGIVPENVPKPEKWVFRRTPPAGKLKVFPLRGRHQVIVHRIVGLDSEEHPNIRGIIPEKIPRPKIKEFRRTPPAG